MTDVQRMIDSGILELYVLGSTSPEETARVEKMIAFHSEIRQEIDAISAALEQYGLAHAVEPDPSIRPFLMATIEYMERMKAGEAPAFPPAIHAGSKIEDYAQWLERADLKLQEPLEDAFAHIIGYTPEVTTAIVWLKYGATPEVHTDEQEKFLVVEGTCDITIGTTVHSLKPGDTLIIPLHAVHYVQVTSDYPCKIILQRAAA